MNSSLITSRPEISQVAIHFLKNSGTGPLKSPIASQVRSIWPSVKYVDDKKKLSGPPNVIYGSAHEGSQV